MVEFRTDVFDAASIEVLIQRWQRVVEAISADPARRLSSIDVLDADEHARLMGSGNRAVLTAPAPAPVSVPQVFAAQVARTPAAVAMTCGDGCSLTYREVEEAVESVGASAGWAGCGCGAVCGVVVGAIR